MTDLADFTLNGTSKCICRRATHCGIPFGREDFSDCLFIDGDNNDKNNNHNFIDIYDILNGEICDLTRAHYAAKSYNEDCICGYCRYIKNVNENKYEECYCCKVKLYTLKHIRCDDCNSVVCRNCYVQGRYFDERFCFDCRRFTMGKSYTYYVKDSFYADNDWMEASWYY